MFVQVKIDGQPVGDPFLIEPGKDEDIDIPVGTPSGTQFELDPATASDPLDGL